MLKLFRAGNFYFHHSQQNLSCGKINSLTRHRLYFHRLFTCHIALSYICTVPNAILYHFSFQLDSNISLQDQVDRMPYDPKWEFPRENLTLLEPIGKGAFGEVWLGKAKGILEFKAEATSMSPTKKKRFSRMFSHSSNYSNVTTSENADNTNVAVKTLKGTFWKHLAFSFGIVIY